ncbi:LOW QUALITY PROTEIN: apolipoprotein D-like [Dreissena polymorpha]|uniref:LOW QUALITY PROTEIN: apolipoprotein D-like n=1 Tax=Dreissena polymorpha TaxID=45954 RepID=UPI0022648F3B|nr:LOW QUALITY PROTEIN: apolipoprotein D-like [Dreissena polymorpha]
MLTKVAIVLFACAYVSAQVPHLGKCPHVTVVQNLNVTKYLGGWYEIEKFFFFHRGQETCIKANYSLKSDGHILVYNRGLKPDGSVDASTGDAVAKDPSVPAKLSVTFNGSPRVPYWVVDTDYDTYSLVWSCEDLAGFVQADFAWILGRQRTLDASIISRLKQKLASFGINTNSFNKTPQENCPF